MAYLFKKYRYFFLLALFFLLLRLPSLFEPYWYGDEGVYLTLGEAINKSVTLYSQIHDNKPPTLYYLAAISQTVFGFRLLLSVVMIPTIYFFYRLAQKFLTQKSSRIATLFFLIITCIPLVEGNIANAEIFMLLPTILGFIYFLNAKKPTDYLASSLFLGIAFTIKVPVAIEFVCLFLILILEKFDLFEKFDLKNIFSKFKSNIFSLLCFLFGFIFPISLWAIYFSFQGALKPFLSAALLQNIGYLSSWTAGHQGASVSSGGLPVRLLLLALSWVIIYLLVLKKKLDKKPAFLLLWFTATIFGALLSARPYPHYIIQVLPPLILLVFGYIKFYGLISIFLLASVIIKYKFYFYPTVSYYTNFYSYALRLKNQESYYRFFGNQVNTTYQVANYIEEHSTSNKIFIWGDEPYVYALANKLPVGRFTVAYHIADFNGYEETMFQLKSAPPQFVVYYQMNDRNFPNLDKFVRQYYYPVKIVDSVIIYQLR